MNVNIDIWSSIRNLWRLWAVLGVVIVSLGIITFLLGLNKKEERQKWIESLKDEKNVKSIKVGAVFLVIFLITVPLLLGFSLGNNSTNWIGFFASYIGSIISVTFATINTEIQIKKADETRIKENQAKILEQLQHLAGELNAPFSEVLDELAKDSTAIIYGEVKLDKTKEATDKFKDFMRLFLQKYNLSLNEDEDKKVLTIFDKFLEDIDSFLKTLDEINLKKVKPSTNVSDENKKSFLELEKNAKNIKDAVNSLTTLVTEFYKKRIN